MAVGSQQSQDPVPISMTQPDTAGSTTPGSCLGLPTRANIHGPAAEFQERRQRPASPGFPPGPARAPSCLQQPSREGGLSTRIFFHRAAWKFPMQEANPAPTRGLLPAQTQHPEPRENSLSPAAFWLLPSTKQHLHSRFPNKTHPTSVSSRVKPYLPAWEAAGRDNPPWHSQVQLHSPPQPRNFSLCGNSQHRDLPHKPPRIHEPTPGGSSAPWAPHPRTVAVSILPGCCSVSAAGFRDGSPISPCPVPQQSSPHRGAEQTGVCRVSSSRSTKEQGINIPFN